MPPRTLAAGEAVTIDFNEEQRAGRLPADFSQGSIELTPDTGQNSIVGEMFNFSDKSGAFVIGPTFSSYPARSTASVWRTDGSFQTTIVVQNTASQSDTVSLRLYSDHNPYIKSFSVGAGEILKINVRDLQQNSVPDDKGNLLTDTSGVVSLVGSHNTKSKLAYDKIIHSLSQADYVGYTSSPCDFVTSIGMFIDFSSGSQPFPVMKEYDWSMSGPEDGVAFGSIVSDSTVAQINNSGSGDMITFSPPTDGVTRSISVDPDFPTEDVTFCDACSAGDEFVAGIPAFNVRAGIEDIWFEDPITLSVALNKCGYSVVPNCQPANGIYCGANHPTAIAACVDSTGIAFQSRVEIYGYFEVQFGARVIGGCLNVKDFNMSTQPADACHAIPPHLGQ